MSWSLEWLSSEDRKKLKIWKQQNAVNRLTEPFPSILGQFHMEFNTMTVTFPGVARFQKDELTLRKRLWLDPKNVHISFRSASIPSTNGHLYVIPSFFQSKKLASIYLWLYHRFPPPKITALKHFFHPLRPLPKKRYNNQQTPSHPTPTPDQNT